jgi:hypothetical protein
MATVDADSQLLWDSDVSARRQALWGIAGGVVGFSLLGWLLFHIDDISPQQNFFPAALSGLIATVYFSITGRLAIVGGEWRCTLTHEALKWTYPSRREGHDVEVPVQEIECLIERCHRDPNRESLLLIRTVDGHEYEIDGEHIGRPARFIEYLKKANERVFLKRESL